MSDDNFLAQTLNSRQLLALLFICEANRKKLSVTPENFEAKQPIDWKDILSNFAERFENCTEQMRFEVLEAHLMSVEDVDVYNNETLQDLLDQNRPLLDYLTIRLEHDPRFQL